MLLELKEIRDKDFESRRSLFMNYGVQKQLHNDIWDACHQHMSEMIKKQPTSLALLKSSSRNIELHEKIESLEERIAELEGALERALRFVNHPPVCALVIQEALKPATGDE